MDTGNRPASEAMRTALARMVVFSVLNFGPVHVVVPELGAGIPHAIVQTYEPPVDHRSVPFTP